MSGDISFFLGGGGGGEKGSVLGRYFKSGSIHGVCYKRTLYLENPGQNFDPH